MKKQDIKRNIQKAVDGRGMCQMFLFYEECYRYLFPLAVNDKFFMYAEEHDFQIDSFCIRPLSDVEEIEQRCDKCGEIAIAECGIKDMVLPQVDISSWKSALESLREIGGNVIIECESEEEYKYAFSIGRIEKTMEDKVRLRHFGADAVWEEKARDIPYDRITSVTFASRYINVFSKYLPEI